MAISVHYHRWPKCGSTHNTACSGYPNGDVCDGPLGPRNPQAGKFICVHSTGTAISTRAFFTFLRKTLRSVGVAKRRVAKRRARRRSTKRRRS